MVEFSQMSRHQLNHQTLSLTLVSTKTTLIGYWLLILTRVIKYLSLFSFFIFFSTIIPASLQF